MFAFQTRHTALLLFAFTQSLILVFSENVDSESKATAEIAIGFLRDQWTKAVESVIHVTDSSCTNEIMTTIEAVKSGEMWALQMLDASSKISSGILRGNVRDLGMYNECIKVNGRYNDTKIRGKYCLVSFGNVSSNDEHLISNPIDGFSSSLCVPSTCNETHVDQILNATIHNLPMIYNIGQKSISTSCVEMQSEDFTIGEILTIALFSTIGAFIFFCTICDLLKRITSSITSVAVDELAKFSLYTNGIALLSTKGNSLTMPAIHGIRFLSICWIILGHRFSTSLLRPTVNLLDVPEWINSWTSVYIQAAPFAVDTFFVVSGFLMSYMYLKSKQCGKKSNFLMMYVHRYLRLTPCLAVLILFVAFLLHRFVPAPARKNLFEMVIDNCQKNGWMNLLYIQNFVNNEKMCLVHTWYLAVDMQLFWISPIILYPLYRWPNYGIGLFGLFLIASFVTPAVVLAANGYTNAMFRVEWGVEPAVRGFFDYYIATYNRACPYLIGIILGSEIANTKRHLSQVNVAINWIATSFLLLLCGWAIHYLYDTNFAYDIALESAFAATLRPFWSAAIAWIIYACTQGYGGPVTTFLSLPLFLPLSRLSYCLYLVHLVIQVTKTLAAQTPAVFSDFNAINDYWGDLVLAIAVALILCLFIESPVIVLEKNLTKRIRKSEQSSLVQSPKKDIEMGT